MAINGRFISGLPTRVRILLPQKKPTQNRYGPHIHTQLSRAKRPLKYSAEQNTKLYFILRSRDQNDCAHQ